LKSSGFYCRIKKKGDTRKFKINALRLFSNYSASATAFRDHTRNFISEIYNRTEDAFGGKYQKKIDSDFKNSDAAQFIENIRNFEQHYRILPLSILTRVKESNLYSRCVLSSSALLKSNFR
jgi:hypothetical protein